MSPVTAYYSIIQFYPDPSRQEAANVGVVLFCPSLRFLAARTSRDNDRIRRFFGRNDTDWDQLNTIKTSIERRLEIDRDEFRDLADLERFAATRANAMRLTAPREIPLEDSSAPGTTLQNLFDRLVGECAKKKSQVLCSLAKAFRSASIAPFVRRKVVVTLPVFQRKITLPYGFQNGRLNLIQPARFKGLTPREILNRAGRHAMEGALIYDNPDPLLGELQLVVVGQFAPVQGEVARTVATLLEKNQTRLYRLDQLDELVAEIRTTAKVPA